MRNPFKQRESIVDEAIGDVLTQMRKIGVDSAEYPKLVVQLDRLMEMRAKEPQNRLSKDTLAIVAGNLMGIMLIVAYEQRHVIRQTAINQVLRPRP